MAHKTNNGENTINKTFIFKAKCEKNDIISLWKPAAEEYCNYYNKLSKWIADNLITMKIGDLAQYITNQNSAYYIAVIDESKKNLPLYKIFQKGFSSLCADNALYCAIKAINPENYNGNILGICPSDYRGSGYVQSVISNFRTKMSSLKVTTKWKKFDVNNVDDETLKIQTICDIDKYGIESIKDFKKFIEVLKMREETPQLNDKIARLECLCGYYSKNEKTINNEIETMAIADLQKFDGCQRKSLNTLTIHKQNSPIEKIGNTSFNLKLIFNKKPYIINLLGNRQVVKFINGKRVDLIDITKKHGDTITFNIKNSELFVHLTVPIEFEKKVYDIKNAVGIDVNIKHMLLSTSIIDNGTVKGYLSIYKELLKDSDFVSTLNDSEYEMYSKMSKNVNFGILEVNSLFERVVNQLHDNDLNNKLIRREEAIMKRLNNIIKSCKDQRIINYINSVKMMRAKYKAYYILKKKRDELQSEYDNMMGFGDSDDPRRKDFQFIDTLEFQKITSKIHRVKQDIIGCRDNIITYAFNIFMNNKYDTISLEYLDNSQFDRWRFTSPKSLLDYYHFRGHTEDEVNQLIKEKNIKKEYYIFKYDNNVLVDIELSKNGEKNLQKSRFVNNIIKAIQFADIKDKFVQLTNNNDMNVVFCPAAFTSQADSKTHCLYFVKGKNNKYVLANSKSVRTQQETHINGENADWNAACNLKYNAENTTFLEMTTKKTKDGKSMYNTPGYNIQKKFKKNVSAVTLNTIKKIGNIKYGNIINGQFIEDK